MRASLRWLLTRQGAAALEWPRSRAGASRERPRDRDPLVRTASSVELPVDDDEERFGLLSLTDQASRRQGDDLTHPATVELLVAEAA